MSSMNKNRNSNKAKTKKKKANRVNSRDEDDSGHYGDVGNKESQRQKQQENNDDQSDSDSAPLVPSMEDQKAAVRVTLEADELERRQNNDHQQQQQEETLSYRGAKYGLSLSPSRAVVTSRAQMENNGDDEIFTKKGHSGPDQTRLERQDPVNDHDNSADATTANATTTTTTTTLSRDDGGVQALDDTRRYPGAYRFRGSQQQQQSTLSSEDYDHHQEETRSGADGPVQNGDTPGAIQATLIEDASVTPFPSTVMDDVHRITTPASGSHDHDDVDNNNNNDNNNMVLVEASTLRKKPWYKVKRIRVVLAVTFLVLIGVVVGVVYGVRAAISDGPPPPKGGRDGNNNDGGGGNNSNDQGRIRMLRSGRPATAVQSEWNIDRSRTRLGVV